MLLYSVGFLGSGSRGVRELRSGNIRRVAIYVKEADRWHGKPGHLELLCQLGALGTIGDSQALPARTRAALQGTVRVRQASKVAIECIQARQLQKASQERES